MPKSAARSWSCASGLPSALSSSPSASRAFSPKRFRPNRHSSNFALCQDILGTASPASNAREAPPPACT
eukprot:12007767-Alexandrium_andersonii.AAC.1